MFLTVWIADSAAVSDVHSKPYLAAVLRSKQLNVTAEKNPLKALIFYTFHIFFHPAPGYFPKPLFFILDSVSHFF